jgi:cysteine desulfurase/selenocysteine lyase
MPPYQGGGEMIAKVTLKKTTFNELPFKFEAGTPNIIGAIATGTALKWFNSLNLKIIQQHENNLLNYANEKLKQIENLKIIGTSKNKTSLISFIVNKIHHLDIGILLDKNAIALRTGHLCTQTLMEHFKISGVVRASFAFYNTFEEIDYFIKTLNKCLKLLK